MGNEIAPNSMGPNTTKLKKPERPFRSAVFRGLGVVVPPLLTIVIFLWVAGTVNQYVLHPTTAGVRYVLVWFAEDIREEVPPAQRAVPADKVPDPENYFYELPDHKFVPLNVYKLVLKHHRSGPMPETAEEVYERYVQLKYLPAHLVVPAFLAIFVLVLYLLGKFMAAGIGRLSVGIFERGVLQLPVVRNVYSSVKQISDFLFSPREIEYTRVVAIEYPRQGIWSLGMVTGESMLDIRAAANEPVLSVLVPTSPMPVTGYTINVKKSEALDLNLTIDQAFQFIVSCGVVVPPQQLQDALDAKAAADDNESAAKGS
ncbi:MAG: DUF502 domain-containing protein [Pirellulales bacterium]|nr:DUF502 domain-containing protein [Pirellulales bacterium]